MPKKTNGAVQQPPCAVLVGDMNTGKTSLLNALLRRELLAVSREDSRALPTVVARTDNREASFAGLDGDGAHTALAQEEVSLVRRDRNNPGGLHALAARLPMVSFDRLLLLDTPGLATETTRTVDLKALDERDRALLVVVTDIEYWSSKHNMDFIAQHHDHFGDALVVVANKADHLNEDEVCRIVDKAPQRLEEYGIKPAPRFFALSARLEMARQAPFNEYRARTKRGVRDRCDAGFDALRVALYEFEARCAPAPRALTFKQVFASPVVETVAARLGAARA